VLYQAELRSEQGQHFRDFSAQRNEIPDQILLDGASRRG
jgi:hypothetical protein